ncbi:hypothetical protein [Schumannella sp. 10F1B-5-1]|uniref:hypothetical protein n=1 Tax=Schumannella sp. 10F1B-5-1 TaxID=2590780 RepID=UPI001131712D|nr:hypothetical protein [Schumannella sp. 10F1B-5-1]TPW76704.1 hypothetical protein FJ658_01820 [Schumannella sp. 10F1B-5-1]
MLRVERVDDVNMSRIRAVGPRARVATVAVVSALIVGAAVAGFVAAPRVHWGVDLAALEWEPTQATPDYLVGSWEYRRGDHAATIEFRADGTAVLTGFPRVTVADQDMDVTWADRDYPPVDATGTWVVHDRQLNDERRISSADVTITGVGAGAGTSGVDDAITRYADYPATSESQPATIVFVADDHDGTDTLYVAFGYGSAPRLIFTRLD